MDSNTLTSYRFNLTYTEKKIFQIPESDPKNWYLTPVSGIKYPNFWDQILVSEIRS